MPRKPQPVEWNSVQYPSMREAARQLGVDDGTVRYRNRMGYTCDGDLMPCVERQKINKLPDKFEWNGIEYGSVAEAAKANSITYAAMRCRILKGYSCDDDMSGNNATNKVAVEWNGTEYESISAAARANDISYSAMAYRLRKGYACDDDMRRSRK